MEKALVYWELNRNNKSFISHYQPRVGMRRLVIPSRIGALHPDGVGLVRAIPPQPGHAELVVLKLIHCPTSRKPLYIAYPFRDNTYPLPGISELHLVTHQPNNDLLETLFIAANMHVRIFKGPPRIDGPKNIEHHDLTVWDQSIRTDSNGQVPCWVRYRMAGPRLIGQAYPSLDFQDEQHRLVTKDLPRTIIVGGKRNGNEIVRIPETGRCRVKIMPREGKFDNPKTWVKLDDGSETFLFMINPKTLGLLENTMYSGEILGCGPERKWIELRLDQYLGVPPLYKRHVPTG